MARKLFWTMLLAAAMPLTAAACGVCIEDKVAATYDFKVVANATRNNHTVLFFELTGLASHGAPTRQAIVSAVEQTPGVERGSVRLSLEQAAVSFAVNASRYPPADMKKRIEKKLAAQQLRLKPLRTIYKGELTEPA